MSLLEGQYYALIQKLHIKLMKDLADEFSKIPMEIQNFTETSSIHAIEVQKIAKAIEHNIKVIYLLRAKRESKIKLKFFLSEDGMPSWEEKQIEQKKPPNKNGEKIFI